MTARAESKSAIERLFCGPLGGLLLRPWYDRLALAAIAGHFCPLSRAWAAALQAQGEVEAFLDAFPPDTPWRARGARLAPWRARGARLAPWPRAGIARALARIEARRLAFDRAEGEWHQAFFGAGSGADDLAAIERRRLASAHALMAARGAFFALNRRRRFPAVAWAIAPEAAVEARHGSRLGDLDRAYPAPAPALAPAMVESRAAAIGEEDTLWLRFASPAPAGAGAGDGADTAWARVICGRGRKPRATVIFAHGIAMETDHWRGLSALPRALAQADIALIRPEGPGHGRRRAPGRYGGEAVLAEGVAGLIDYMHAHVVELGLLVAWARARFGGPVAIGGVSLGALTAQVAACAASHWPAEMRPDALLLVATTGALDGAALDGSLARRLGTPEALAAHGWTPAKVGRFLPLVEPQGPPACGPDNTVMLLGGADDVTPFAGGMALARRWGVAGDNLAIRRQGHFTVSLGLYCADGPWRRLAEILLA